MSTLMSRATFIELAKIRRSLRGGPLPDTDDGRLAGIFVPWAGNRLKEGGGIYIVGMASDGDYWADEPQRFDRRLHIVESLCTNRHDRARTPWWRFLNGLTTALLGGPFYETADRWGWSNLLKIGWSKGNPDQWPAPVKSLLEARQQQVCRIALQEELAKLENSTIVIATNRTFRVFEPTWPRHTRDEAGIYWYRDAGASNLYVHCYHPGSALRQGIFQAAIDTIVELA